MFIFNTKPEDPALRLALLQNAIATIGTITQSVNESGNTPKFALVTNIQMNGELGDHHVVADEEAEGGIFEERDETMKSYLQTLKGTDNTYPRIAFFCFTEELQALEMAAASTAMRILAAKYGIMTRETTELKNIKSMVPQTPRLAE